MTTITHFVAACRFSRLVIATMAMAFAIVAASSREIAATTFVGGGADYSLSISDGERVAVMELTHSAYEMWALGDTSSTPSFELTNRIYNHFEDAFDFIVFASNESSTRSGAAYSGRYFGVQNDTPGISVSFFDRTGLYGSAGALQGAIHLTTKSGLRGGPSLHEFMHRWANFLESIPPGAPVGPHWGFAGVGGQLGGFEPGTLQHLGGNLYDADGPRGGTSFGTFGVHDSSGGGLADDIGVGRFGWRLEVGLDMEVHHGGVDDTAGGSGSGSGGAREEA